MPHALTRALVLTTFCGLPVEAYFEYFPDQGASSECLGLLRVRESRGHPVTAIQPSLRFSCCQHLTSALCAHQLSHKYNAFRGQVPVPLHLKCV